RMAWEDRNGRKYFYLSQREGNKIRKIYFGCGEAGRAAELALECRREAKNRPRDWLREAARKFAELDAIDAELAVGLVAILFAQYGIRMDTRAARRINRRRRGDQIKEGTVCETSLTPKEQETWQRLCEQASRGDQEAAAALLPFRDEHPQLTDRLGDLSKLALNNWLNLVAGRDEVGKRTIHAKVLRLIDSLRRDTDGPLERLLTRRVGLFWLQLKYVDIQLAEAMSRTPQEQEFLAKRQLATQQAYAATTQALRDYQARGSRSSQQRR
ncbi:MAG: hypothetical protein IAG10_15390, partial [Planctomycetaceae bacterium]|nr:hypothetical protein [Planctomycetaceae bacterium]